VRAAAITAALTYLALGRVVTAISIVQSNDVGRDLVPGKQQERAAERARDRSGLLPAGC
jgi:hypothetical protein